MTAPPAEPVDGPWRVAARFSVALRGGGDAAAVLEAALAGAGLPVAEARAVPAGEALAALREAAASGIDVLLLDGGTAIAPDAVAELRRVANGDPMIAAAVPTFAAGPERLPPGAVPDVDYVLLPDHRCLYAKASVLAELGDAAAWSGADWGGAADDVAGPLLALNRLGFRVAAAGRAGASHPEGPGPREPAAVPAAWRPAFRRHRDAAPRLADALMGALRPGPDGRRAIAFDLSHLGPRHSGTAGLARALLRRAATRWTDLALHVVATPETFAFHCGGLGGAAARVDPAEPRRFAALIRLGQPFLWGEMDAAARRAPVLVLFMLDAIGLDCQQDAPDELDALWRFCLAEADGLLFNSAFTRRQFARRFALPPGRPASTSLHSLDLADYRVADALDAPADGAVLVIGNAMPHKRLRETARLLAAAGLPRPVTALGLEPGAVAGVESLASGAVTPERVAALHAAARVVVYPSAYEGFGFPILDALAHRRPVLVRPLPPYAEIAAGLPEGANIHGFDRDADLLRLLRHPPSWTEARRGGPVRDWGDAAADLRAVLDAALLGADRARVVRRIDLLRGRMAFMRARAFDDDGNDDGLDRLAGAAGRVARDGVLWAGRRLPGARGLLGMIGRAARRPT